MGIQRIIRSLFGLLGLTDEELIAERERTQIEHCHGKDRYHRLFAIDREIARREQKKHPYKPSNSRPWSDKNRWEKD